MGAASDEQPRGFTFPPEFADCITEIVSFWAFVDYSIDMSIWHLAGVFPAIGACMTAQIYSFDGRMKALAALLNFRRAPSALIKRANRFAESSRKALNVRNRVAHDCWFQKTDTKEILQLKVGAKGVLTYAIKHVSIEALRADREVVRKAMREAGAIRDAIEAVLPTLPEIPLRELLPMTRASPAPQQNQSTAEQFALYPPKPSQQ
jgi:hypothetical protein